MAKTSEQAILAKDDVLGRIQSFPVKSGQTMYKGTLAAIDNDGYLVNLSSTYIYEARKVVLVADGSANSSGPAATTSAGSQTAGLDVHSAPAGDKTWRDCYIDGIYEFTFTAIAQSDVGKTAYASDNFTLDESQLSGVKVGTIVEYLSATSAYVDLNNFGRAGDTIRLKTALTATTGTVAGSTFSWINPTGETILIKNFIIDITTGSTGAATIDVGVAANGSTTADTLIDGLATSNTGVFCNLVNNGTNGGMDRAAAGEYITATPSATLAGLVAPVLIEYTIFE